MRKNTAYEIIQEGDRIIIKRTRSNHASIIYDGLDTQEAYRVMARRKRQEQNENRGTRKNHSKRIAPEGDRAIINCPEPEAVAVSQKPGLEPCPAVDSNGQYSLFDLL
jgi:isocitrate lyase